MQLVIVSANCEKCALDSGQPGAHESRPRLPADADPLGDEILIRFAGFQIDPAARSLQHEGQAIALGPKTFDLLVYLAQHAQQVVTKEELLAAVWPNSFVEEGNLSQHVFLLRKALANAGQAGQQGQLIVTVPSKGYLFAARVELGPQQLTSLGETSAAPAAAAPGELVLHAVQSVTRVVVEEETEDDATPVLELAAPPRRRRWVAPVVVSVIVVLGAGAALLGWRRLHPVRGHIDVVLADVENTTGDTDFDRTLKQALLIDLEQTPFLNLLSRSEIQEALSEMERDRTSELTPALAMEICERTNAQAMLHGSVAKLGSSYVLILNADSCVSGKQIAGYKAEAANKEDVLRALDAAAGHVRQQLGESSASLDKYQIPVTQATTPSLDALRAFSEAGESFRHGDMKASQILLQQAVALDPNFASAYRAIGSTYYNLGDFNQAAAFYKKAFDLRERTTERERLGIEVMYYGYGLNDYEESIRRTRQLLEIYPNATNSWVSLSNLYTNLGEYPQAIDAAAQATRLDPQSSVATVELARSYLRGNHLAESAQVAAKAIVEGKNHWDVHSILFQIAFAQQDAARMKEEGEWGLSHQHANTSLDDLGCAAATEGRLRTAEDYFARARAAALRDGESDFAEGVLLRSARAEVELEEPARATETLKQMKATQGHPSDPGEVAYLQATIGDVAVAQRFVAAADSQENRNTLIVGVYIPLVRARLALRANQAAEAVRLLEPARVYQLRDFTVPALRAEAEAQAGMLDGAEADYRLILENQGVDPISPLYSLAHLQLARVLVRETKIDQARKEYMAFLAAWKNADADLKLVGDARRELAELH